MLFSIHAAAATTFKTPEIALDPNEAENLAKALAELEKHYPTSVDPRVMAWINFAGVAGMIYGPRVFAYQMRKSNERQEKRGTPPAGSLTTVEEVINNAGGEQVDMSAAIYTDNFATSINS